MRITGGMFRGRRLQTVQAAVLRPTQDRVREALFSTLADIVPGCAFLDLYAGTGSVGIEAWSRGAARVCWVEENRRIFRVLAQNVRALAGTVKDGKVQPYCMDVGFFCQRAIAGCFDVVYADPPYARNRAAEADVLRVLARSTVLQPDGMLILEQGADEAVPVAAEWMLVWERRYGSSMLRILRKKG
ncbi:MAG: 16S rRNA (guanine(966)-N(2))-methyltransferase RsmD [Kiritimatiellia bacterium]